MKSLREGTFEVVSPREAERTLGSRAATNPPSGDASGVAFRGSYDDVLSYFEAQMWSDGLPISLPTPQRVERMLGHSNRDPDQVIGVAGDGTIRATVWNTAVNAVMAGCRDQDFPIALALAEIMADPKFRIRDAGSTTGWEVLVMLSGPDLPERGFNVEAGVMRLGRRANTALGRFTRLWTQNVAGILIPPGYTDMAAIGQSFHVAMAENDEMTRAVGWPTCREEWGYAPGDLVVAAQGIVGVSAPIYTAGEAAADHVRLLAIAIAGASGHIAGIGISTGRWEPVLAVNPLIAELFTRNGLSKDDVRSALAEHAQVAAQLLSDGLLGIGRPQLDLAGLVTDGVLPARYHESDEPARLVPVIPNPEQLAIVVTGNLGRNQSKFYIPIGQPGRRMVRRVEISHPTTDNSD